MPSEVYEEIKRIASKIEGIKGAIGIILFGSFSRGDYDEGSDVDLLIVFKDKDALNEGFRKVYEATSESGLFFQAICLTIHELKGSSLLELIMREGKIYCANGEVRNLLTSAYKPYAIITYSAANLSPKERVVFIQRLEGRGRGKHRYEGLMRKLGGYKIGRGVMMIPIESLKALTQYLEEKGVDYVIRYAWS